jgi:hypothetical protein
MSEQQNKHNKIEVVLTLDPNIINRELYDEDKPVTWSEFENERWSRYLTIPFVLGVSHYAALKRWVYDHIINPSFFNKQTDLQFDESGTTLKRYRKVPVFFYDGLCHLSKTIKKETASSSGVERIYEYKFNQPDIHPNFVSYIMSDYWQKLMNSQALRNRFKLVRQVIYHEIQKQVDKGHQEIRFLSLASGAARNILETIYNFKKKGVIVKALLVDINGEALQVARKTAEEYGISDQIEIRKEDVFETQDAIRAFKPHIVEMLGLIDYKNKDTAIRLSKIANDVLEEGGVLITCNVMPNIERHFVTHAICWPAFYRTEEELFHIAKESGFDDSHLQIEPLKIYAAIVMIK